MASCVKCGATLIAQARFCATCGSPVGRGSAVPTGGPSKSVSPPALDPFARTMLRDDPTPSTEPAPAPGPAQPPAAAFAPVPNPFPPPGPQYAQPAEQPTHAIPPGTLVLVHWADGQRYPGTVLQVSAHHVFVAFPNGIQQWIDARYVTVGA